MLGLAVVKSETLNWMNIAKPAPNQLGQLVSSSVSNFSSSKLLCMCARVHVCASMHASALMHHCKNLYEFSGSIISFLSCQWQTKDAFFI